jgi:hypothetical protein
MISICNSRRTTMCASTFKGSSTHVGLCVDSAAAGSEWCVRTLARAPAPVSGARLRDAPIGAGMAQEFPLRLPAIEESEHFGSSSDGRFRAGGCNHLQAIEDFPRWLWLRALAAWGLLAGNRLLIDSNRPAPRIRRCNLRTMGVLRRTKAAARHKGARRYWQGTISFDKLPQCAIGHSARCALVCDERCRSGIIYGN